jgi:hypothetical protein
VTSRSERGDILTPGMMEARQRREVLVASGAPDGRLRRGVFSRSWNSQMPHLNSRDGAAVMRRGGSAGSAGLFSDSGSDGTDGES